MISEVLNAEDLKILSEPFDDKTIGVKINNLSKDKTKAMLILYLQHTDVYDRIERVDPTWSCEAKAPMILETVAKDGRIIKTIGISMKMTIKKVSRENVGEGDDYKSAYSDAIKRVAMLFGIGRYLYDSEQVWVPYNEQTDRYKQWTMQDFKKHSKTQPKAPEAPKQKNTAAQDYFEPLPSLPAGDEVLSIGKNQGKSFSEVFLKDPGYCNFVKTQVEKTGIAKSHRDFVKFYEFLKSHEGTT